MSKFLFKKTPPVVSSWWLQGGVSSSDVVCAYQPKGALSLADSYKNLNSIGVQDAIATVPPTWNATDGWIFNGIDQYLDTGAEPASTWSVLCRFSDATGFGAYMFGIVNSASGEYHSFMHFDNNTTHQYVMGASPISVLGAKTVGVVGISQYQGYFDGITDGTASTPKIWENTGASLTYLIGCYNLAGDSPASFDIVKIQAFSLYNKTLTAPQMLAISTAMANL